MPKSRRDKRRLAMLKNSGPQRWLHPAGSHGTQGSRECVAPPKMMKHLQELCPEWRGTSTMLRHHCEALIEQATTDNRGQEAVLMVRPEAEGEGSR